MPHSNTLHPVPHTVPMLPQVCTKYCVFSSRDMASLSGAAVRAAVDTARQRLGVNKIDLMQLYWADYSIPRYVDAALYLTELQAAGVLGAVGVTNMDVPRLAEMVDAGAAIASNQVWMRAPSAAATSAAADAADSVAAVPAWEGPALACRWAGASYMMPLKHLV
jgi:Aldo/keto reductase family